MTKCIIDRTGHGPVIDWSTGQPRVFQTTEDAHSWAKLSCYGSYKVKPLNQKEKGE